MIRNQYLGKFITSQCLKLLPYFGPIHNGYPIIMFSNLSDTGRQARIKNSKAPGHNILSIPPNRARLGFRGIFEHGTVSLRHACKHNEVVPPSRLSHVRILQVADRL